MTRRTDGRASRVAKLTAVVATVGLVSTGCGFSIYDLPLPGGADVGENPYSVKIEFRDVLDLVPQSSVKVDDVSVGKVTDVTLNGWAATVTVEVNGDVKLPDNAVAELRQTSLLGEKFVSLSPPEGAPAEGELGNGDVIPIARTGRNPEVEEFLAALSLVLNGGGIGQLKNITVELNHALQGREPQIRSVLTQLSTFMGQLDDRKGDIITALEKVNNLAISVRRQKGAIIEALDTLPGALDTLDKQRGDLVKMLKGLDRLSGVATRVIKASKADTVRNLQLLEPILGQLNAAGDALPKAFQVFLTYPFINAAVGETVVEAKNTHMGDYTNLAVQLDINLQTLLQALPIGPLPDPGEVCDGLPSPLPDICDSLPPTPDPTDCPTILPPGVPCPTVLIPGQKKSDSPKVPQLPTVPQLPKPPKTPKVPSVPVPGGSDPGGADPSLCKILGLCRTGPFSVVPQVEVSDYGPGLVQKQSREELGYDPDLVGLFLTGMVAS